MDSFDREKLARLPCAAALAATVAMASGAGFPPGLRSLWVPSGYDCGALLAAGWRRFPDSVCMLWHPALRPPPVDGRA